MNIARTITAMQQSGQVVHVISRRIARILERRGLVRMTVVQPAPIDGVAVNLTVAGKSFRSAKPEPTREPEPLTELHQR